MTKKSKNKRCIVYMPTGLYYRLAARLKKNGISVSEFTRLRAKEELKLSP